MQPLEGVGRRTGRDGGRVGHTIVIGPHPPGVWCGEEEHGIEVADKPPATPVRPTPLPPPTLKWHAGTKTHRPRCPCRCYLDRKEKHH